jgi:hypothetical protein
LRTRTWRFNQKAQQLKQEEKDKIIMPSKFPDTFSSQSGDLPEDVRSAFLEVLYQSLLYIRVSAHKQALCFALSDHAHNIPYFIREPKPVLLQYYWNLERPCFLRKMQELNETVSVFEPHWKIIEQEYERLKKRSVG